MELLTWTIISLLSFCEAERVSAQINVIINKGLTRNNSSLLRRYSAAENKEIVFLVKPLLSRGGSALDT